MKTNIKNLALFLLSPILTLGLAGCTNESPAPAAPVVTIAPPSLAEFKELSVEIVGTGSVLVKGIICSAAYSPCKVQIPTGESVVMSVLPGDGQAFYRWENCASSLGTVCTQMVNEKASVRAVFVAATPENPAFNCAVGTVLSGSSCMALVKTCTIDTKNGNQTWNPSTLSYGACLANPDNLTCAPGSVLLGAQCLALVRSCLLSNGAGVESLNTSTNTYGACVANSCNSGYSVSGNSCVVSSCPTGQHVENNACVSNIQSCSPINGTGIKVWNQGSSTFSGCQLTACNASYVISNDGLSCTAASQSNPCTSGMVWNGVSGSGSTCTTPVSSTCASGQYWNGTQCSDVSSTYTTLASFNYGAGGTPSGFESIAGSPAVYTMFIGRTYDIVPVLSANSGIAVFYSNDNCSASKINVGLNGRISFLSSATYTAGESYSCTIKATNPVGLVTSLPITVKFDNATLNPNSLNVQNFTLHDSVDMLTKKFCPVVANGSFVGGSYSLLNSNGTTLTLSGKAGGISFSSTDGCISSTYAGGMFYYDESVVAKGASRVYPGFTVQWSKSGSTPVTSNVFDITYSRIDDDQSLMSFNIANKFIRLLTNSRRNAMTGSEDNSIQLPQITAGMTLVQMMSSSIAANVTPVVNLQPTSSTTDGTISKNLLSTSIPIQTESTTALAQSVSANIGAFRQTIFDSKYTLNVTNSASAIYSATSMALSYLPSDSGTAVSVGSRVGKLDPGATILDDYVLSSNYRTIAKQADSSTGELFAQISFQFRKLGAAAYTSTMKILLSDSTKFDETLTAKRMPIAFTDAEDFVGIQSANTTSFYSDTTAANRKNSIDHPVIRFGNRTFFIITKTVSNSYQKILAYYDLDPAITNPDLRTTLVLTPLPNASAMCGGKLCYPEDVNSPMQIYKSGSKLVVVRQIPSNASGTAKTVYAVLVLDPNDLGNTAGNKAFVFETADTFNAHSYVSESDGVIFFSGNGYLNIFDVATGVLKNVVVPTTNLGDYYKFIKVGTGKYVIGNDVINGNQITDVKSFYLDLGTNTARFISLSNNPSGFNTCQLVGAGYDVTSGVKASFICSYASSTVKKLMSYFEHSVDGGGLETYFIQSSNIKNTASDILDYQLFVKTLPDGNAVIMAAGDSQASQSAFYSVRHSTDSTGAASIKMQKINLTGDIGSQWGGPPSGADYMVSGNKLTVVMNNGNSTFSMYSYDEASSSTKTYYTLGVEGMYNDTPFQDELGNVYIHGRIVKPDGSIVKLNNSGSLHVKDFSNGKLLFTDSLSNRYYVADVTKNYEYQLEDVNSLITAQSDTNSNNRGLIVGEGAIVNIKTDYNTLRRNFFIDLSPIQAK